MEHPLIWVGILGAIASVVTAKFPNMLTILGIAWLGLIAIGIVIVIAAQ